MTSSCASNSSSSASLISCEDTQFEMSPPTSQRSSHNALDKKTNEVARTAVNSRPENNSTLRGNYFTASPAIPLQKDSSLPTAANKSPPLNLTPPPLPSTAYRGTPATTPPVSREAALENLKMVFINANREGLFDNPEIFPPYSPPAPSSPEISNGKSGSKLLNNLNQLYQEKIKKLEIEKTALMEELERLQPHHEYEWSLFLEYTLEKTVQLSKEVRNLFNILRIASRPVACKYMKTLESICNNLKKFSLEEDFKNHPLYIDKAQTLPPCIPIPTSSLNSSSASSSLRATALAFESEVSQNQLTITIANKNHKEALDTIRIAVYYATLESLVETLSQCERDLVKEFNSNPIPTNLKECFECLRSAIAKYIAPLDPGSITAKASKDFQLFKSLYKK